MVNHSKILKQINHRNLCRPVKNGKTKNKSFILPTADQKNKWLVVRKKCIMSMPNNHPIKKTIDKSLKNNVHYDVIS